jgi:hypothetical protein
MVLVVVMQIMRVLMIGVRMGGVLVMVMQIGRVLVMALTRMMSMVVIVVMMVIVMVIVMIIMQFAEPPLASHTTVQR